MKRLLATASVLLIWLVVPALAHAATASRISNTVVISAAEDETNNIDVHAGAGDVLLTGTVTAGGGCSSVDSGFVECGEYSTLTFVAAILGGGNDRVDVVWPFSDASPPDVMIESRAGHDRIIGGSGESRLVGGSGDDRLGGEHPCCSDPEEAGEDELDGGPGDDILFGGGDDDQLTGGPGRDTADYGASDTRGNTPAVRVALHRGIATGAGTDSIETCERVIGSDRADLLIGDGGRNKLAGRSGRDVLRGRDGRDTLLGQGDNDLLRARDGRRDVVRGGQGAADRATVDAADVVRSVEIF